MYANQNKVQFSERPVNKTIKKMIVYIDGR